MPNLEDLPGADESYWIRSTDTTRFAPLTDDLAVDLKLTDRMVRYNLPSVESVLDGHGLRLARRRGVGIWVEGSPTARRELLTALDAVTAEKTGAAFTFHRLKALTVYGYFTSKPVEQDILKVQMFFNGTSVEADRWNRAFIPCSYRNTPLKTRGKLLIPRDRLRRVFITFGGPAGPWSLR